MANFMKALEDELNVTKSENGAVMYRSAGSDLLDMNFSLPYLRIEDEDYIWEKFDHMASPYLDDPESMILLFKWLFYVRDVREGVGERRTFRVILKRALTNNIKYFFASNLLSLIPIYGRWDDLVSMIYLHPSNANEIIINDLIIKIISKQLKVDMGALASKQPVSLLAKWLPSINTSSKETRRYGYKIMWMLHYTPREYRKLLSNLRRYIDVTEVKMSTNQWNDINYAGVPSNANLRYKNAFMKHDAERRQEFLESLKRGEIKINSKVLFPHEIIAKYRQSDAYNRLSYYDNTDTTLEELWKALPNNVEAKQNTLVVCDTSGSMINPVPGANSVFAIDASIGLGIYFAERMQGQFHNKIISFSMNPKLVDLNRCTSGTLLEKIRFVQREAEGFNTDISKVMGLILNTAIENNLTQEDMPDNILLVSDMEFDIAIRESTVPKHDFDFYAKTFTDHGYKMPRIIFWNVNSRTNGIPMKENDLGIALVSGFSTNLCKLVMSKEKDPLEALVEQLDTERYRPIEEAIRYTYKI